MQYLLTEEEYAKLKLIETFGQPKDLCENCKYANDESGITTCNALRAFAQVAADHAVMFGVTDCYEFAPVEEDGDEKA